MQHGDKPHKTEDEDSDMKAAGRHLYKVLMDHTVIEVKQVVVGAPERDGV